MPPGTDHGPTKGVTVARIGLVGFFGWGNFGDELFLENWKRTVGLHHDVEVVHQLTKAPYFTRRAKDIAAEYDAFIIGGGDLVIPTKISPLYWNREWLAKPIYIAGIGVPTWMPNHSADVMARMSSFLQHPNVRYIETRDAESAEWITEHLKPSIPVSWSTDLVFGMVMPPPALFDRPTVGVNLRSHSARAETDALVETCQDVVARGYDLVNIVLGTGITREADLEVARAFPVGAQRIVESESLDDLCSVLGGLDLLISNKFHGTVVATKYTVPSVVLSSTTKSRNLYRVLGRTHLLSSHNDPTLKEKVAKRPPRVAIDAVEQLEGRATHSLNRLVRKINEDFPKRAAPMLGW